MHEELKKKLTDNRARLVSELDVSVSFLGLLLSKGVIAEEHKTVVQNYDSIDLKKSNPSDIIQGFTKVDSKGQELEDYIDPENRHLTALGHRSIIYVFEICDVRKIVPYQELNGELIWRIAISIDFTSMQSIEALCHIAKFIVTAGCVSDERLLPRELRRVMNDNMFCLEKLIGACEFRKERLQELGRIQKLKVMESYELGLSNVQLFNNGMFDVLTSEEKRHLLEIPVIEGKDAISTLVDKYSLFGKRVYSMIKSNVLSLPTSERRQAIYSYFGEKKSECFEFSIVYETFDTCARNILKSEFVSQIVHKDWKCKLLLVDESDTMLIDQVVHCTNLSHDASTIFKVNSLEQILGLMWVAVDNRSAFYDNTEIVSHETRQEVFSVALSDMTEEEWNRAKNEYLKKNMNVLKKWHAQILNYEKEDSIDFAKTDWNGNIGGQISSYSQPYSLHHVFDLDRNVQERISIPIFDNWLSPVSQLRDMIEKSFDEMINNRIRNENDIDISFYSEDIFKNCSQKWISSVCNDKEFKSGFIGTDDAIHLLNYESTGLEMKHGFPISHFPRKTSSMSNIRFFEQRDSNIFGIPETRVRAEKQTSICDEQSGSREAGEIFEGEMNQLWFPFGTVDEAKQDCTDWLRIRTKKLINAMQKIYIQLKNAPHMFSTCSSGEHDEDHADIKSKSPNPQVEQSKFSVVSEETCAQRISNLNAIHDSHSKQNSFEFFPRRVELQQEDFDSNINTNKNGAFLNTEIPNHVESPEKNVLSDLTPNIFGTRHDELDRNSFQVKGESMKRNNIITGNDPIGCCDAAVHPRECLNPNKLKKEYLPRMMSCQSNTTSWLKLTSSTSTTRILNFCRSTLRLSISHITQLGLQSCFIYAWLFLVMLPLVPALTAETIVNLQQLTVMKGQSVRISCSVNRPDPVTWWHEYVGTGDPNYIYYQDFGLMGQYRSGGRHSIEDGTKNLMIKNVTDSDAGKYTCDGNEMGEPVDIYDVVILKSMPTCRSNIDLADVIGENDCGIDPDLLQLHCSVVYSGNFAPVLRWQNSGGEHAMIATKVSTPIRDETDHTTESTLTVTANMRLNGTYFTCQVADSQSDGVAPEFRTENVTVQSLRNSSVAPKINLKSEKEISCTANSNQPCKYQWTHQYEEYNIVVYKSTLNFQDVSFGDGIYECQATCRLRGRTCLTTPRRITVVAGGMNNSDKTVGGSATPIVFIVFLVVLIVALAVTFPLLLKYRRRAHERGSYLT